VPQEREQEIAQLRRRIARLTEEARNNEEAWKRNQQREMQLLEAQTLEVLLSFLTDGLRAAYELDAAALLLADADHKIRHLLIDQGGRPEALLAVRFVDSLADAAPALARLRKPWLGPFAHAQHAPLFGDKGRVRSVALLPLLRHGVPIALLGMGSGEPRRFTAKHATDFLQQTCCARWHGASRPRYAPATCPPATAERNSRSFCRRRTVEPAARWPSEFASPCSARRSRSPAAGAGSR
jgi:two-component system cell cycle response regulator